MHDKIKDKQCEDCESALCTNQELKQHIAVVHNNERPFECSRDGCDTRFSYSIKPEIS